MAFVVTHQHPNHLSLLPELLDRAGELSVVLVERRAEPAPNHIYLPPPGKHIALMENVLHVVSPETIEQHWPIDHFFRSLAMDQKERLICIVLSGTGSDGTIGVRAIKGEGGMVMAQDSSTAKHPGMPQSAQGTGLVDFVLPPERMAEKLRLYVAGLNARSEAAVENDLHDLRAARPTR